MRILTPERVLFTGRHLCPEFDCPEGSLPDKLQVLLCLLDGIERRKHLQAKLNRLGRAKLNRLGRRTSAQRNR